MLSMIIVALVILACSQRNRPSTATDVENGKAAMFYDDADVSPKVVVIMAGDKVPTYLAKPAGVK